MELPGHLGVALLVYAPVAAVAIRRGRSRRAWFGLAGVFALATSPDVDLYLAGVPHRGVTHSLLAALVAAGVSAVLACLLDSRGSGARIDAARSGATIGGLGVLSHLLGDVITPMGIRPFLPLSDTTYTLSLVYAADPAANSWLLVGGIAVFATTVSVARVPVPERAPTIGIRRSGRVWRAEADGLASNRFTDGHSFPTTSARRGS